MNIFVLDENPLLAALYHNDKHCVKMIVESCQLLSNAHHTHGVGGPYRHTHKHHPANKWVTESTGNYKWLLSLAFSLCGEYTKRYHRIHKCASLLIDSQPGGLITIPSGIPEGDRTPFWSPKGYEYGPGTEYNNAVEAYRAYYLNEKTHLARWRKGEWKPDWWTKEVV